MAAPFSWRRSQYFPFAGNQIPVLLSIGAVFLLLCIATVIQIALDLQSPITELSHGVIRLSFLVYCSICIYFLQGDAFQVCVRWLRRILTLLALYGIYQVPAKFLGLPLFLDWLRNNPSFSLYDYDTAGWVKIIRATSIYAEPAQCTVPILVLILLNIYVPAPRYSKWIVWIVALTFAALTFSRTIWIAILALIIAGLLSRIRTFSRQNYWGTRAVAGLLLIATILLPMWAFYSGNYESDVSRQERAGSVVIGLRLIREHPWIGSGWNSYETLMPSHSVGVEGASPNVTFDTIHNLFVSYAEQAGIAGFVFGLLPFAIMLFASDAPDGLRLGSVCSLLAVAELGGDVAYSSLFWLWVAIIVNWPADEANDRTLAVRNV